jgi:hypothetical protein
MMLNFALSRHKDKRRPFGQTDIDAEVANEAQGDKLMNRKKWQDLTLVQQISITLAATMQFLLLAAALWDIRHRAADEINGSKQVWTAAAFVNFVGPIAYFVFGRKR